MLLLVRLLVLPYPLAGALSLPPSSHLTRAGTALAQAASLRFASLLGVRPMRHFTLCRPTPPRTCAGSKPAYMRGATHPSTTAALGRCHQPHTQQDLPLLVPAAAWWCARCAFALACPRLSSPFPTHLLGVYLAKLCALSLPNSQHSLPSVSLVTLPTFVTGQALVRQCGQGQQRRPWATKYGSRRKIQPGTS